MSDPLRDVVKEAVANTDSTTPAGLANAVVAEVKADPVAQNALSQEPWFQSRVANYGSLAALMGAFGLAQQFGAHGFGLEKWNAWEATQDLTIAGAGAMVVYGRFVRGLKPMWHRLFGGT
jgi:hypothetical protein